VSTRVPCFGSSRNLGFHPTSSRSRLGIPQASDACGTMALSVEFVAKPEKAKSAPAFLPNAILGSLKEVAGFAGCMVMSSDQEARLITVITFWTGSDCHKRCNENVRWVRAILASYVDRCLRVQTLLAHAPLTADFPAETNDAEAGLMLQESAPVEETVCVA